MSTTEERPELLTLLELAKFLRVGQRTAYRLAREGDVPAVKVGGQWRVPRAELERHLAGREEAAP
jgi:excisionase family DNA binding protein